MRLTPAPLIVMGLGFAYALFVKLGGASHAGLVGFRLPVFRPMTLDDLRRGAVLLALPQIPLSLGNSVIATSQTTRDLFPDRAVSVRKIGVRRGGVTTPSSVDTTTAEYPVAR